MYKAVARPIVAMVLKLLDPTLGGEALKKQVEEVVDAIPVGTAIGAIAAVVYALVTRSDEEQS